MASRPKTFRSLPSVADARSQYLAALRLGPRGTERIPLAEGLGRVLAADIVAATDLPPFERSAVDGWAVRAADVAAASAEGPVRLTIAGEVVMGTAARVAVGAAGAVRVPTGGMLPAGADTVVMQEHTRRDADTVAVLRPATAGDNIISRAADVRAGDVVLRRGRRLRPADLGVLAGLGHPEVSVTLPPRVAILTTGDEVVPASAPLGAGQVRDMNGPALAGAVRRAGGIHALLGIVADEYAAVDAAVRRAWADNEVVLISGGSSVGDRDVVAEVLGSLGSPGIIVHGIAVRPGKPTVLAACGTVPVIGLPGNPVSALVIFDLFARPVIEALLGLDPSGEPWRLVRARLAAPLRGTEREDHRRVRLEVRDDGYWAVPLPAGSQVLTSLVQADGIVVVPPRVTLDAGADVEVRLIE